MIKQWTVRKLLTLGFGLAILISLSLNLVSLWQFQQSQETVKMLLNSDLPLLSGLSHIEKDLDAHRRYEKNFFLSLGDAPAQQKYLQNFRETAEKTASDLKDIAEKIASDDDLSPEIIQKGRSLSALHRKYVDGFVKHVQMINNTPAITPQQANKMMASLKQTVHLMESQIEFLQHSAEEMIEENSIELISATDSTRNLLITGLAGSILLILVAGYYISRKITTVLGGAIASLNISAVQISNMAAEISAGSQTMADAASNQAASLEETSASMEEMSSQTKVNADNSNQADQLMQQTGTIVAKAQNSMTELTTSMSEISSASEETSKIVQTIDEISFQTNLLALNAAVEAARAGEAGAGFAVVADEVRNLAMRAAEAAKETAILIDDTVNKIHAGEELVNRTDSEFSQVAESSIQTAGLVGEIHVASSEQAQGIGQVNQTIAQMDEVVQQVAANAEESAGAAQQMSGQTDDLLTAMQALSRLTGTDLNLLSEPQPTRTHQNIRLLSDKS